MKLRLPLRHVPSNPNPDRPIPSNTLHIRHRHRLLLRNPYLPRRQLRLNPTISPRQRSFHILHLPVFTRRPRHLLWLLHIHRNMKHRNYSPLHRHSNSIYRVCPPMRTNIFLRRNSHHQPSLSHPLYWNQPRRVGLRWLLRRQSHSHSILCPPLSSSIHHYSPSNGTLAIPTRNRLK